MSTIYDKTGREIMVGDTLRVFHFIGPRRKQFFMYKYVMERAPDHGGKYMRISHLNPKSESYLKLMDDKAHPEIEIVQGYGSDGTRYDKRPVNKSVLNPQSP